MRTKRKEKATAIFTSDWHIRADVPICRTDDYFNAMEQKLFHIFGLARANNCPIIIAGDIGHKPSWPNWLLEWFIRISKGIQIIAIPGQHDLPNHKLELWRKSAIGVLKESHAVDVMIDCGINGMYNDFSLVTFPYGDEIDKIDMVSSHPVIAVAHQMVIENKKLWPGQKAPKGHQLLKKYPEYDVILTGDNHNQFTVEYEGRPLINPGSLMRMTADQIDHQPRVYLWYSKSNKIRPVDLPIEEDVINRDHIDITNERNERMDAYLERMKHDTEVALSFEDNLKRYFNNHKTKKSIKEKVWANVE